jgi:transglutaminase-like putative cysteine protease
MSSGLQIVVVGARGLAQLRVLLGALFDANVHQIRARGGVPPIKQTGIRYQREPRGQERWQTVTELLRSKIGDCEDLAAYEAARLRVAGVNARPEILPQGRQPDGRMLYHAVVVLPGGRIYDVCPALGMKRP